MLEVDNQTPFSCFSGIFGDAKGQEYPHVLIKGCFAILPSVSLAETPPEITHGDKYRGEALTSSLIYPSDIHPGKASTDVIVNALAWPEDGQAVTELDVTLSVAERQQTLRVFGPRYWQRNGVASPPEPFQFMPITYEWAFGGVYIDPQTQERRIEGRNPVGIGFHPGHPATAAEMETPLPNIENPAQLIREPNDLVAPAGWGAIAPWWRPRCQFAGTYDSAWRMQRAPAPPHDMDARFFNAAHPDWIFGRYLTGGEPVVLQGVHRRGLLSFRLPRVTLEVIAKTPSAHEAATAKLETVLFEPELNRLSLVWRATFPLKSSDSASGSVMVRLAQLAFDS